MEGEGGRLKCGDGEKGFKFFVRERGSGMGADQERKKKEGIKDFEFFGLFFEKKELHVT